MSNRSQETPLDEVAEVMRRVRHRHPLVHCLTNHVVKGFTANVLLAIEAAPAMVEHPEEAAQFASIADALLVNLGTLDEAQMPAIRAAVQAAASSSRRWVLDPVAVGPLAVRTRFAIDLLETPPTVIRGNASEILALAGESGGGRGVDSASDSRAAVGAARALASRIGGTVLVTGAVDYVVGPSREVSISNGHPLLTRVTGVGCAMGAINAACLAVADDAFTASLATALWLAIAGELAAGTTQRPGSFQIALLDALDALDEPTLRERAKLGTA